MKKLLALLLTVAMLVSVVYVMPITASAQEVEVPTEAPVEIQTDFGVDEVDDSIPSEVDDSIPSEDENSSDENVLYAEIERFVGDTSNDKNITENVRQKYEASFASALSAYVNIASLKQYLINAFASCPRTDVDIYSYRIPTSKWDALCDLIFYDTPQLFQIQSLGGKTKGSYLSSIHVNKYPSYCDSASEYTTLMRQINKGANALLTGVRNNSRLTDLQKMIILHDRIAANCEYDPNKLSNGEYRDQDYAMTGVFVDKVAVCQGYANAYKYLLDQIGIESYMCRSLNLDHSWNLVKVGSYYYHVDITWDDTGSPLDSKGRVAHNNFLRSNAGNWNTGHEAYDYDKPTNNSTYDSYFWQNSNAEFVVVGNTVYYYDSTCGDLKTYSGTVKSNQSTWSYGRILADGSYIYITTPYNVLKYDTTTNVTTVAYTPALYSGHEIYGLYKENGYIYCTTGSTIYTTQTKYQIATSIPSATEMFLNNKYDVDIAYGGQVKTYSFTPTTSGKYAIHSIGDMDTNVQLYDENNNLLASDADSGEGSNFQLICELVAGRTYTFEVGFADPSQSGYFEFIFGVTYSVTYSANGGKGAPKAGVKGYQAPMTISTWKPTRSGYIFLGWATSKKATTATYKSGATYPANINYNTTLYAVWKKGSLGATAVLKGKLLDYKTIKVFWRAVPGADGYRVYYKKASAKSYKYVGIVTGTSYTNVFTVGTKYNFKVIPCMKNNSGTYTNGKAKTLTYSTGRLLNAPSWMTATLYGYDDVQLKWGKVPYATKYKIYYKKNGASSYTYKGMTSSTSYKMANLTDGALYNFAVLPCISVNGSYIDAAYYRWIERYTLKKVPTPRIYKYSSSRVLVEIDNILGETGYEISKSTSKNGTNVVFTIMITDPDTVGGYYQQDLYAPVGKTYYYKVRAYSTENGKKIYGPWSTVVKYKMS